MSPTQSSSADRIVERWECPTHITAWAPVLQADETPLCGRRGCGQPLSLVQYIPRPAAECPHRDAITCGNDGFLTCLDCGAETTDVGRVKVFISALVAIEQQTQRMGGDFARINTVAREALGMDE